MSEIDKGPNPRQFDGFEERERLREKIRFLEARLAEKNLDNAKLREATQELARANEHLTQVNENLAEANKRLSEIKK